MRAKSSVPSPISTGESGAFFEQHVGASFLSLLLVHGIPPILLDCQVNEVHFQTGYLGWSTDDLLIIGSEQIDSCRKLAVQVRREFTISKGKTKSRKVFVRFWNDYRNTDLFNPENDRLALITQLGTNTLLGKFNSLLDCARASNNPEDFYNRLKPGGYLSEKAVTYANDIRTIINEDTDDKPTDHEFWKFLRSIYVVSYDLQTSTASTEALIKGLLAFSASGPNPLAVAEATWNELLSIVGSMSGMASAGSFAHETLPEKLRENHQTIPSIHGATLNSLRSHCDVTLNRIQTTISGTLAIDRGRIELNILDALEDKQVILIHGSAGIGKSAIAK